MSPPVRPAFDVALVGGGLACGLIALALRRAHPALRIALVERTSRPGNQTWCCFASDLELALAAPARSRALMDGLVAHRWAGHEVVFPAGSRRFDGEYLCVTADRLREAVRDTLDRPGSGMIAGEAAAELAPGRVVLESGRTVSAPVVLDGRGVADGGWRQGVGFQKFLGQEVLVRSAVTKGPGHAFQIPRIMDATTAQTDGYRFTYVLPLARDRLLIEDTSFSDGSALDVDERRANVARYATAAGLEVVEVVREESGVLPMPWRAPPDPLARANEGIAAVGYRGGFFHAATGYSLPTALAVADTIATADLSRGFPAIAAALQPIADRMQTQNRFFRLLNRLLFRGVHPERRRDLFARVYTLPDSLIRRFYAATTTFADRVRLLSGRPPPGFDIGRLISRQEAR